MLAAGHEAVEWVTDADPASQIRSTALPAALAVRDAAVAGDMARALAALDRHRLLCAHRDGPYGVRHWNRRIEQWLAAETGDPLHERDYLGRPLLVTANDYALRRLQRRHRRRGGDARRRPPGRDRRRRRRSRSTSPRPGSATWRPCTR